MATELSFLVVPAIEAFHSRDGAMWNYVGEQLKDVGLSAEHLTLAEFVEIFSPESQCQFLTLSEREQIATKDVRYKLGIVYEWIYACMLLESAAEYAMLFDRRAAFLRQFESLLTEDNHGFVTDTLRNVLVWTQLPDFTLSADYSSFEEWLVICIETLIKAKIYAFLHGIVYELQRVTSIMIPEIDVAICLLQTRMKTSIRRVQRIINVTEKILEDQPVVIIEAPPVYSPPTPQAETVAAIETRLLTETCPPQTENCPPIEICAPAVACTPGNISATIRLIDRSRQVRRKLSFYAPDVNMIRQTLLKNRATESDKGSVFEIVSDENTRIKHRRRSSIRKIGSKLKEKLRAAFHHEINV